MARKPDTPCASCGKLLWRGSTSLPPGRARCQPCRREATRLASQSASERRTRPMPACEACGKICPRRQSRTCSRECGYWINSASVLFCPVPWSRCMNCDGWHVSGKGRSLIARSTCSAECADAARAVLSWKPNPQLGQPQVCAFCDTEFTNQHTTIAVYCSRHCSRKMGKQRRRTRDNSSHGEWRWSDFMVIARRHGYCCAYCGTKPARLDPDHVVPVSRGGENIIGNLLPACPACNSSKRDLLLHEWDEWLTQHGMPARTTTWTADDSRFTHLTSVRAHVAA